MSVEIEWIEEASKTRGFVERQALIGYGALPFERLLAGSKNGNRKNAHYAIDDLRNLQVPSLHNYIPIYDSNFN